METIEKKEAAERSSTGRVGSGGGCVGMGWGGGRVAERKPGGAERWRSVARVDGV